MNKTEETFLSMKIILLRKMIGTITEEEYDEYKELWNSLPWYIKVYHRIWWFLEYGDW